MARYKLWRAMIFYICRNNNLLFKFVDGVYESVA